MRELPILFSGEMVKAILDGTKTQTRRIIKPHIVDRFVYDPSGALLCSYRVGDLDGYPTIDDAPYQIGYILYVRETWAQLDMDCRVVPGKLDIDEWKGCPIAYKADHIDPKGDGSVNPIKWRPNIHMPKEAARIWLEVTDVRVERLNEITEEDAVAEGVVNKPHYMTYGGEKCLAIHKRYINEFSTLWDSTIKKQDLPLYGWDASPWVWVYGLKRLEGYR